MIIYFFVERPHVTRGFKQENLFFSFLNEKVKTVVVHYYINTNNTSFILIFFILLFLFNIVLTTLTTDA